MGLNTDFIQHFWNEAWDCSRVLDHLPSQAGSVLRPLCPIPLVKISSSTKGWFYRQLCKNVDYALLPSRFLHPPPLPSDRSEQPGLGLSASRPWPGLLSWPSSLQASPLLQPSALFLSVTYTWLLPFGMKILRLKACILCSFVQQIFIVTLCKALLSRYRAWSREHERPKSLPVISFHADGDIDNKQEKQAKF